MLGWLLGGRVCVLSVQLTNATPQTLIFTEGCAVEPGVVNIPKNTCFHDEHLGSGLSTSTCNGIAHAKSVSVEQDPRGHTCRVNI